MSLDLTDSAITGANFNALGGEVADMTGLTSPTVTITTTPAATDPDTDLTIWTSKNWTVAL